MDDGTRFCAACGTSLAGRAVTALTCSPKCKQRQKELRRIERRRAARPAFVKQCGACAQEFVTSRTDKSYCDPHCRSVADGRRYRANLGNRPQDSMLWARGRATGIMKQVRTRVFGKGLHVWCPFCGGHAWPRAEDGSRQHERRCPWGCGVEFDLNEDEVAYVLSDEGVSAALADVKARARKISA